MLDVKSEAVTREIIGAGMEVHRTLGPGYLESIYQRAMIRELGGRGLPIRTEMAVDILYKGESVGRHRMDLIVAGEVVVELKCVSKLAEVHRAQTISYLKATGIAVGLVLNFAGTSLNWQRIIFNKSVKSA
jgi:GxxExxY protein